MSKSMKQRYFLLALIITLSSIQVSPTLANDSEANAAAADAPAVRQQTTTASLPASAAGAALIAVANKPAPEAAVAAAGNGSQQGSSGQTDDSQTGDDSAAGTTGGSSSETGGQAAGQKESANNSESAHSTSGQKPIDPEEQVEAVEPASVGYVDLGGGSSATVQDAAILPTDSGNVVAFTLHVTNGGSQDIDFLDYGVRLMNKSGSQFTVDLQTPDKDNRQIPAGTSLNLHYYAKVGSAVSLADLRIKVFKWDFSVDGFEKELGVIAIPADYAELTPVSKARTFTVTGTTVKARITKVVLNSSDKYNVPTIYFDMENIGKKNAALASYQFYIRTSAGLLYPLTAEGLAQTEISPQFEKEIQLSGSLPASVKPGDWTLVVAFKDDTAKVTVPVVNYDLPGADADWGSVSIPSGEAITLDVGDNKLQASVTKVFTNKNDKYNDNSIYVTMKNIGTTSLTVPKYQISLKTADGLSYPATVDNLDNLTIDPQVSKEVTAHISVPVEVDLKGAKLVISSPINANDPNGDAVPLAFFDLPLSNQSTATVGQTVKFTNDDGDYGARLDSIERLPWQDKDILSARLALTNSSAVSTLPIPAITGKFVLDDAVEIPIQVVQEGNVVGIKPYGEVQLNLFGSIPYDYNYSKLRLVLQEKVDDKTTNTLLEFASDAATLTPKEIAVGNSYTLESSGKKAALAINEVRTYQGVDDKEVAALLNVQNLEKRSVNVPNLVAYFETPDGAMYPATISQLEGPVTPNSVVTLYVTTTMPSDTSPENLRLLVGQAVTGTPSGQQTGSGTGSNNANNSNANTASPVAYVNAVSFALPTENTEPQHNFDRLQVYPYTISMSNFKLDVASASKFTLSFDYELSKAPVAATSNEHTLEIEFYDPRGGEVFSKEFELGKDTGLKVGKYTQDIVVTDESVLLKMPYFQDFQINVYDKYNGMKKLIASNTIPWE